MDKCKVTIEINGQGHFYLAYGGTVLSSEHHDDLHVFIIELTEGVPAEMVVIQTASKNLSSFFAIARKEVAVGEKKKKKSSIFSNYWKHGYLRQPFCIVSKKNSKVKLSITNVTKQATNGIFVSFPIIVVVSDKNHVIKERGTCRLFPSKRVEHSFYLARALPAMALTVVSLLCIILWIYWSFITADESLYIYYDELIITSFFWRNVAAPIGTILLLLGLTIYQWVRFGRLKKLFDQSQTY